jgi:hypothetical protein
LRYDRSLSFPGIVYPVSVAQRPNSPLRRRRAANQAAAVRPLPSHPIPLTFALRSILKCDPGGVFVRRGFRASSETMHVTGRVESAQSCGSDQSFPPSLGFPIIFAMTP